MGSVRFNGSERSVSFLRRKRTTKGNSVDGLEKQWILSRGVILLLLISGCVTTNATRLGSEKYRPPVSPQEVVLYRTAEQVPGRYEEVALLHSTGNSNVTNEPQMYESMRQKAAEVGANAVILDAISEPSAGAKIASIVFNTPAERKGKAIAIYVFPSNGGSSLSVVSPSPDPSTTGDIQLRNAEREFRAGRMSLEEFRSIKKVLQTGQ
jgi:hypothetical protein